MAAVVRLSPFGPRERLIGLALAALLHALLGGGILYGQGLLVLPEATPVVIEVEFVPAPEPPPPPLVLDAPPPPSPEAFILPPPPVLDEAAPVARESRPAPAPGPESPRPGPTEHARGPSPEPPAPAADPHRPPLVLRGGEIPSSSAPRRIAPPSLIDNSPFTVGRADRRAGSGGSAEAMERSEGDFILSQVMRHWLIDYRSPRFRDVLLNAPVTLNADGTLGYPFGKSDPWQPEQMVGNWLELQRPQMEPVKVAVESLLRAVRAAQPFQLPPGVAGGYPRRIRLYFRMGDL
jgi:hypothetical protein